jgi:mRNA interferase RelE/StbE
MLKIEVSKTAAKFLKKLPPKHARQVAQKIQGLRESPEPHDSQPLRGHPFYRRADIGEYRIVYYVSTDGSTLLVDIVGKRNDDDVYKQLSRK